MQAQRENERFVDECARGVWASLSVINDHARRTRNKGIEDLVYIVNEAPDTDLATAARLVLARIAAHDGDVHAADPVKAIDNPYGSDEERDCWLWAAINGRPYKGRHEIEDLLGKNAEFYDVAGIEADATWEIPPMRYWKHLTSEEYWDIIARHDITA